MNANVLNKKSRRFIMHRKSADYIKTKDDMVQAVKSVFKNDLKIKQSLEAWV